MPETHVEMGEEKMRRLEAAGWQTVTVEELLDLSSDEASEIEHRLRIHENDTVS